MKKINLKLGLLIVLILLGAKASLASTTDGTIDPGNKYAWSDNAGWINFAPTNGNVHITDTELTGFIWNQNYGWINLSPTNGGVINDGNGNLSGYAWSSMLGWINFSGIMVNSSGQFSGSAATGSFLGTLIFNCTNCSVTTDWRPPSVRNAAVPPPSGGGGGGGPSTSSGLTPSPQSTPPAQPLLPDLPPDFVPILTPIAEAQAPPPTPGFSFSDDEEIPEVEVPQILFDISTEPVSSAPQHNRGFWIIPVVSLLVLLLIYLYRRRQRAKARERIIAMQKTNEDKNNEIDETAL